MYYRIITLSFRSKKFPGELPGGPVVRVLPYISTAGAMGSIPGPEAKISHATQGNQNKQTNKQTNLIFISEMDTLFHCFYYVLS